MVSYDIIATGSSGNAVIVGKSVLIDCGVAYKRIEPHKNEVKLVLLTHIHGDHFNPSTIGRLANEKPLIRFGACRWLVKPLVEAGVKPEKIDVFDIGNVYDYGICKVIPFSLLHDVPNCGYKVHFPGGKVIYATDTENLNGIEAKDYDLYLIEGNYDEEEINERIKEKVLLGQYAYEMRVKKTHLSHRQCDEFVAKNIGSTGRYVYLHEHMGGTV